MNSFRPDLFIGAQAAIWPQPLVEIYAGEKQTHWIWFVFPQLAELGRSERAKLFGLTPENAIRYLEHDELGPRLLDTCAAFNLTSSTLGSMRQRRVQVQPLDLFGEPDVWKVRSCLTLFAWASKYTDHGALIFDALLDKRYAGERCPETERLLEDVAVHRPGWANRPRY